MNIYLIGDLHGSFKPVRDFYQRNPKLHKPENQVDNVLICLGDFGGNYFFDYRDDNFKKKLGKYPFTYFVIRGNHEERASNCANRNPDKWTEEKYFDGLVLVEKEYPYIKYASDIPCIYNINNYSTFVLPGAYSVDKFYRISNGWSWFKDEQLSLEEMKFGKMLKKEHHNTFDLVLSHTCPIYYEPTDLFLSFVDQNSVDKTMERYLGNIEFELNYKAWCWGHYHKYREYPRDIVKPSYNDSRQLMLDWNSVVSLESVMNNPGCLKVL